MQQKDRDRKSFRKQKEEEVKVTKLTIKYKKIEVKTTKH